MTLISKSILTFTLCSIGYMCEIQILIMAQIPILGLV